MQLVVAVRPAFEVDVLPSLSEFQARTVTGQRIGTAVLDQHRYVEGRRRAVEFDRQAAHDASEGQRGRPTDVRIFAVGAGDRLVARDDSMVEPERYFESWTNPADGANQREDGTRRLERAGQTNPRAGRNHALIRAFLRRLWVSIQSVGQGQIAAHGVTVEDSRARWVPASCFLDEQVDILEHGLGSRYEEMLPFAQSVATQVHGDHRDVLSIVEMSHGLVPSAVLGKAMQEDDQRARQLRILVRRPIVARQSQAVFRLDFELSHSAMMSELCEQRKKPSPLRTGVISIRKRRHCERRKHGRLFSQPWTYSLDFHIGEYCTNNEPNGGICRVAGRDGQTCPVCHLFFFHLIDPSANGGSAR